MNKYPIILLVVFLLSMWPFAAQGESVFSQLDHLEKAVAICVDRLDSDILLPGVKTELFRAAAHRQLEFAILSLGKPILLEEDYFHFALYLIARHYCQYCLAIELLEYEYRLAGFKTLKNWLQKRIDTIRVLQKAPCPVDKGFSIKNEFKSFKEMLKSS